MAPEASRRRRRAFPWTTARRAVQILALASFVWLFLGARSGTIDSGIANAAMRIDPLALLAQGISSRQFAAGSALALTTVVLTLILGRAWCGWLCPLGALLDLIPLRSDRRPKAPPEAWRAVKHAMWMAILGAAVLGSLTLLVLDPLTISLRTLTTAVWPGLERAVSLLEEAAYRLPALHSSVEAFDRLVRPAILPAEGLVARGGPGIAVLLLAILLLNIVAERFWCRYLCPLGGLLGVISKVALVQRRVEDGCGGCQLCVRRCPTATIRAGRGHASDPAECTMCMACLEACPLGGTRFPARIGRPRWNDYDPGRRQALLGIGAAVVGVGLLRLPSADSRASPRCLRPPGSTQAGILSACMRCGACLRVCPTGALQPALLEGGLEGWWSPVVVPRLGYCDFSCTACGQICPSGAIPLLTLEDKRRAVIGRAKLDRERCLPWAEDRDCIVCEEMCPLPTKAVVLEQFDGVGRTGERVSIQRPIVLEARCIGCGICEYKCPVVGEAAIRVFRDREPQA